jgi:hypothetical protein
VTAPTGKRGRAAVAAAASKVREVGVRNRSTAGVGTAVEAQVGAALVALVAVRAAREESRSFRRIRRRRRCLRGQFGRRSRSIGSICASGRRASREYARFRGTEGTSAGTARRSNSEKAGRARSKLCCRRAVPASPGSNSSIHPARSEGGGHPFGSGRLRLGMVVGSAVTEEAKKPVAAAHTCRLCLRHSRGRRCR